MTTITLSTEDHLKIEILINAAFSIGSSEVKMPSGETVALAEIAVDIKRLLKNQKQKNDTGSSI